MRERPTDPQIWSNYDLDLAEKSTKALTAKIALVFICFVNTLPLMVITFLTNLDAVCRIPFTLAH